MSKLDLTESVYELTKEYPQLIEIMSELGFKEITKKAMLNSVGKLTTIPKGAKMKGIPMERIVSVFRENGFEVDFEMEEVNKVKAEEAPIVSDKDSRRELLKDYLKRLNSGEELEAVRADFVKNFSDVEASEIMEAEQELLKEGTPLEDVQKLCDVHSALFHGATREEKIANAEKAVEESLQQKKIREELKKRDSYPKKDYSDKNARAAALVAIAGHPLNTLTKENNALTDLLAQARENSNISLIRDISVHYAKKGDLLYPLLKVKYGVSGPSDVMWTVDDEIRDEISLLAKTENHDSKWNERFENVLKRAEEMIYKEQNILFPICAVNFTEDEWKGIYRDSQDYDLCFGVEKTVWLEAETVTESKVAYDGEIVMPGGHMTLEQLTALLNTLPIEITFVDADNINRYFNEGPKVFKRPNMAIDREVFSCHPPKIEPMVRSIIEDFRSGVRDSVPVWMDKGGKCFLVTYMAVRDKNKNYLGTVEVVQNMEFAKLHFTE
ncbi:MAG: DUF438 domain-containing protein [Eubacterium sp.]|nr:DUF438 domain-containing protein [Eubacterium sp.]